MILYKYVTLDRAISFLDKLTLRFTPSYDLNDPFELTTSAYESPDMEYNSVDNHFSQMTITESFGILSLSRSPYKPLMWSHYAKGKRIFKPEHIEFGLDNDSHGGIVIGIDSETAGLESLEYNILPAKFGSVIYTRTKPTNPFSGSDNPFILEGMFQSYKSDHLEALQRIFLYKSLEWSYEEEVRVIRNVHRVIPTELNKQNGQILTIPKESVKEIYIGSRQSNCDRSTDFLKLLIKGSLPSCNIYKCTKKEKTWGMNSIQIN